MREKLWAQPVSPQHWEPALRGGGEVTCHSFGVVLEGPGALPNTCGVKDSGVPVRMSFGALILSLCFLQTDQQAEARSYLSEEMIAGE